MQPQSGCIATGIVHAGDAKMERGATGNRRKPAANHLYQTRSGNLVKPSLKINGIEALLDDTLPSSRALVLHSERRLALETDGSLAWYLEKWGIVGADEAGKATAPTTEESVIGKMDGDWLIYGAPLAPDDNEVIYSDDAASSHNADVSIVWRPKYY